MDVIKPDFRALSEKVFEHREKFKAFYALLLDFNTRFNLTAITEGGEVFHKHFLDSLAGEGYFPHGACVAEVGSGAGFPSIPLKIVRDDLKFVLIESIGKKCEFLRACVEELGFSGVEIVCARAEKIGRDGRYREKADVCTARAVARLSTLAEYCLPLVRRGGTFVAYKGDAEEETREAEHAFSVLGGGKVLRVEYELPNGYGGRNLVVAEKIKEMPKKYPRGNGAERRDPL